MGVVGGFLGEDNRILTEVMMEATSGSMLITSH